MQARSHYEHDTVYDVLIIGCGILGASTAYSCAKSNVSTIILEQYSTHQHEFGGSFGTSRAWRTAYPSPIYADMMLNALNIWKEIEIKTSTNLLTYCGGLDFGPKNSALKDVVNTLKLNKHKYEILTSSETMNRFKPIKIPSDYISVYTPNHYGTIHANKATNAVIECAKKLGCHIKYNQKVTKIEKINNLKYKIYVEHSADGSNAEIYYFAKHIVFACGAYKLPKIINCDKINKKISFLTKNIMKRTAFNVVYFRNLTNKNFPVWAEYDDKNVCNWYGMITPKYTPFGTMYCMKVGDSASNVPDWNDNNNINAFDNIKNYVKKRFNKEDDKNVIIFECKKCYLIETKDDNFIIDRIDNNENIYLLSGSHTFKHAPQIGEMMKKLILHFEKPNDIFLLSRFNRSKL